MISKFSSEAPPQTDELRKMHLLNKSGEPPHPNPLPPGERGVIERNHLKNSLPLDGGGLGRG